MPFLDLDAAMQERVVCSIAAAVKYAVPANIVLAVAEKEAGKPGQRTRNSNGTQDFGPMQLNTVYLKDLARYGITANDVAAAGCYSFELATWRLRQHIKNDSGDLWTRAANFHSRTFQYNVVYRADLIRRAARWADWLEARFVTYEFKSRSARPPSAPAQATGTIAARVRQPARDLSRHPSGYTPRGLIINQQPLLRTPRIER